LAGDQVLDNAAATSGDKFVTFLNLDNVFGAALTIAPRPQHVGQMRLFLANTNQDDVTTDGKRHTIQGVNLQ
jgi:hypothetical protein